MSDPLERIERQLQAASRRYVALRRARRRMLVAAAIAVGLLAAASVASAVSGVGPVAGIFADDDFAPPSARPAPGGRRALLTATGGGERWDVLVYRRAGSLTRQAGVRDYCVAAARGRLSSIGCQYPPTLAARILQKRLELGSGGAHSRTTPVFGLAVAGLRRLSVTEAGGKPVQARLSRPFRLVIPRLPERVRDQLESPSQQRATRGLPRGIAVRAFLAVVEPRRRPTSLELRASFAGGGTERRTLAIRPPAPAMPAPDMRPAPDRPSVSLRAGRWRMRGFETRGGSTCIAAEIPERPRGRAAGSACAGWSGVASGLARLGSFANRPDLVESPGTYPVYGLVRADAARVVVLDPRGRPRRARLSRVWRTMVRPRDYLAEARGAEARRLRRLPSSVKVRAFLAVAPSPPTPGSGRGVRVVVTLADGRTLRDH